VDLVAFEEAGHAFALPIMFLTVAAAWRGHWRLASLLAAAVFLTNWPGLIGLGFALAGILVARKTPARAAGLVGAAYVLDDARILRLFVSSQSHCSPSHSHRRAVEPNHVADPRGRRASDLSLVLTPRAA
jgi:hypothetical protein